MKKTKKDIEFNFSSDQCDIIGSDCSDINFFINNQKYTAAEIVNIVNIFNILKKYGLWHCICAFTVINTESMTYKTYCNMNEVNMTEEEYNLLHANRKNLNGVFGAAVHRTKI